MLKSKNIEFSSMRMTFIKECESEVKKNPRHGGFLHRRFFLPRS